MNPSDRGSEDRVLGVEAAEKRHPRNRQGPDQHAVSRRRHLLDQAAQGRHLVGVDAMVHAAGPKEQKRLEKGMRQQMKQAGRPASNAQGKHHEAKLTDGRVSQDFLVIGLGHRDRRRDEKGNPAGVGYRQEHIVGEDWKEPANQIDSRRHHRRRVDQRRDRGWAGHGVGKPDVQRKLRTLADATGKYPQSSQGQQPERNLPRPPRDGVGQRAMGFTIDELDDFATCRSGCAHGVQIARGASEPLIDFLEIERPEGGPENAQAHQHPYVADPVDDERLVRRVAIDLLFVPEADEQVGTKTDQFPEDEDHEQIRRRDQAEHRETEERQIGEELRVARIVVHVADRVPVDQGRDERHHEKHEDAQIVDVDPQGDGEVGLGRARRGRRDPPSQPDPIHIRRPDDGAVMSEGCGAMLGPATGFGFSSLGRGFVPVAPGCVKSVIVDEADQAEHTRKTDCARREVCVEMLQLPDENGLDRESRQGNQHGGHVKPDLPAHARLVSFVGRSRTALGKKHYFGIPIGPRARSGCARAALEQWHPDRPGRSRPSGEAP